MSIRGISPAGCRRRTRHLTSTLLRAVAITGICISAVACTAAEVSSVTLNFEWKSQYVGLSGGVFHDEPVFQTTIAAALGSGFSVEVFHSGAAFARYFDNDNGWASEVDYAVGWSRELGVLSVSARIAYCDCGRLFRARNDGVNTSVQVSLASGFARSLLVRPFVKIVDYHTVDGAPWNGFRVFVGARQGAKIARRLTLDSLAAFAYDDGAFGTTPGFIACAGIALSFPVWRKLQVSIPTIDFYTPLQSLSDERKTRIVLGACARVAF